MRFTKSKHKVFPGCQWLFCVMALLAFATTVRAGGGPPIYSANPTNGPLPLFVQFTGPTNDGNSNAITGWAWAFGDGAISTNQNPSHTYTNVGSFTPDLTVSNLVDGTNFALGPSITVAQGSSVVTWIPAPITYGAALGINQLNASANVPGSFVYNPTSGTILDSGSNILVVTFTPTDSVDYNTTTNLVNLVVSQAPLTVMAANATNIQGQAFSAFTGMIDGVTNGDDFSVAYSTSVSNTAPPGIYTNAIVPALLDPDNRETNYIVTFIEGNLDILNPPALSISPSAIGNNYTGTVTLQMTALPVGATVIVQKYLDANSNGVVDSGDLLVQQYQVTDGVAPPMLDAVTNINIPGDTDFVPGQITTLFNPILCGAEQMLSANYLYVISSPANAFSPITNQLTVTNAYGQSISGNVKANGTNVPFAEVWLLAPLTTNGGNSFLGGTVADAAGNYSIAAEAGSYRLLATAAGFVGSNGVAVTLMANASVNTNLTLTSATVTISGSLTDATNSNQGLPGILLKADLQNTVIGLGTTDSNGNFSLPAISGVFNVGPSDLSLALQGYVNLSSKAVADTTGGSVSNLFLTQPLGTALIFGSVTDVNANAYPGVRIDAGDAEGSGAYEGEGLTDQNGNYVIAVVGDDWNVAVDNNNPLYADYLFSTGPSWTYQNGGSGFDLDDFAVVEADFSAIPAPNGISGFVIDDNSHPVVGVEIFAINASEGITNFDLSAFTDNTGFYSFQLPSGNWDISVNCLGGSNSLSALNYDCVSDMTVNLPGGSTNINFTPITNIPPAINLVSNGGFETGDFTGWNITGDTEGLEIETGPSSAHSGTYGADFEAVGDLSFISQTLATVPGTTYFLSFWLDSPDGEGPNEFSVSWNGQTIWSEEDIPAIGWTNVQLVLTATHNSTVLQFAGRNDPSGLDLDDVELEKNFIQFTATPVSGQASLPVQFTSPATDSGGHAVLNWLWNFGDGTAMVTNQSPLHIYTNTGTFSPGFLAVNNLGATVQGFGPDILVQPPTVVATASPTSGQGPLTVQFTAPSVDSYGNQITSWFWNFGDGEEGGASISQNPTFTYANNGTYFPTLRVINTNGLMITADAPSISVSPFNGQVQNGGFETGDFTGWSLTGDIINVIADDDGDTSGIPTHSGRYLAALQTTTGMGVLSQSLATSPGSNYIISFWFNAPANSTPNQFLVSWDENTVFTQTNAITPGWTNIQLVLTATGSNTMLAFSFVESNEWLGLDDVDVESNYIQFTATPSAGPDPLTVQFNAPGTDSSGNAITTWNWSFGDGNTSSSQSPNYTYARGNYTPVLVAVNTNGATIPAFGPAIQSLQTAHYTSPYAFTTIAGQPDVFGYYDGASYVAQLNQPYGAAVDGAGNVYLADTDNDVIRKVAPNGAVTTLAGQAGVEGSTNGIGGVALFDLPQGLALDAAGNIYVADTGNDMIRKITLVGSNWTVTTLAGLPQSPGTNDGNNTVAQFDSPQAVAVDAAGNVYVADFANDEIRQVTPAGVVTTLAGQAGIEGNADGVGTNAMFNSPTSLAVDGASNIYVADFGNFTIREISPVGSNWSVTTLAGTSGVQGFDDGPGSLALFYYPYGIAVDAGTNLYVGDYYNFTIRRLTASNANWVVSTLGGQPQVPGTNDGTGSAALFNYPGGIAVDGAGHIYVADSGNSTLRKGSPTTFSTPLLSWTNPSPILLGAALGTNQLDATASVPGTFIYTPAAGTIPTVGTNVLSVVFNPDNGADYSSVSGSVTIVVVPPVVSDLADDAGLTTLRNLVSIASPGAVITFAPAVSNAAITLANGPIALNQNIIIDASAIGGMSINGNGASEIFDVGSNATVVLNSLTLTNGFNAGSGGAIVNNGDLTVNLCVFTGCTGAGGGGAIENDGTLAVNQSIFTGNLTTVDASGGGGIENYGTLVVSNSTMYNNNAGQGGGIFNRSTMLVNQSTFVSNTVVYGGGGIFNFGTGVINQSTFTLNQTTSPTTNAQDGGGGILAYQGSLTFFNTIVAGNNGYITTDLKINSGTFTPAGVNLTNGAPLLRPFGNYGGPTPTMPPQPNSPVIDAGSDTATNLFTTDQRGFPRLSGAHVDIGAVEISPLVLPTLTWANPAPINYGVALGTNQLDATANVAGSFAYTPTNGTVLTVGGHTLAVVFTPSDTNDYTNATTNVAINVLPTVASITWSNPASIPYGTPLGSNQLDAVANIPGTYIYSPTNGTMLTAGSYTLSVVFTPTDTNDYSGLTTNVTLVVTAAHATVTWPNPAPIIFGTALGSNQLNATANTPGSFSYVPAGGTVLPVGTNSLVAVFTPVDSVNYIITAANSSIIVQPATAVLTWSNPPSISYGTALGSNQLNATANIPGSFAYNPTTGAILPAGSNTLSAIFTPTDTSNFSTITTNVSITVLRVVPTLNWTVPAAITYGAALGSNQLNATASVPGNFTYNPTTGAVLPAGSNSISALFVPTDTNDYFNNSTSISLVVLPATTTLTWSNPAPISYGTGLGASQLNATANTPGNFVYNPTNGAILPLGSNTLSVTFTPSDTNDYQSASTSVSILVQQGTPAIVWPTPAAITYGTALSSNQLNATANTPGSFVYTPTNGTLLGVGSYTLSVVFTPFDTVDYLGATNSVSLVVEPVADSIVLNQPTNGQAFLTTDVVNLMATEAGSTPITAVDFYNGTNLLGAVTSAPYTLNLGNLPAGSYALSAVATDDVSFFLQSAVSHVTVGIPGTMLIDFDALDASAGPVSGTLLNNYLAAYGVSIINATGGSSLAVQADSNIGNGNITAAYSESNVLTQIGTNGAISYTLAFNSPCTSVSWVRAALLDINGGVVAPEWTATAYDINSNEISQVGENQVFSATALPAAPFTLLGSNISYVTFAANNSIGSLATLPLDNLLLSTNSISPVPQITLSSINFISGAPGQLTLFAQASENGGNISRIDFYENQALVGSALALNGTSVSASLPITSLAPGAYAFYAVATDANGVSHTSTTLNLTVTPVAGVQIINFDSGTLNTSIGAVSGAALSNYLAGFGVTISNATLGASPEAVNENSFTGNELPVPSSQPNLFTQTGLNQPLTFTLNFAAPLQNFGFTRVGMNTNGPSAISHPAWSAHILDASGKELESVSEPLLFSSNNIPPRAFNLFGSNIASVRFDSDSQKTAAFDAVLLDDLVLNANAAGSLLSISLAQPGGSFTAPATVQLNATAMDNYTNIDHVDFYSGSVLVGTATAPGNSSSFAAAFTWTNVLNGTYTLTAQLVDSTGYARVSTPVTVTVAAGGNSTVVNFDSLSAAGGPVGNPQLASYLSGNGLNVASNSAQTTVVVENQTNVAGGGFALASSPPNLLTQIGSNGPVSFTVGFSHLLSQFSFTRPELLAAPFVTHPAWQVQAYDILGLPLGGISAPQISSLTNVPAQIYTLNGAGIASVAFNSQGSGLTTFNSMLLDDFTLTAGNASNLAPSILILNPSPNAVFATTQIPLRATASAGSGTVTNVTYYYGGTNLIGSSATSPYPVAWTAPGNGTYALTAVAVNNSGLIRTSPVVNITVATGFAFVTPPLSQTVALNGPVTFGATTTLGSGVSFQWNFNGSPLAGQTSNTLYLPSAQLSNSGSYTVIAANNIGQSITSQPPAILTVLAPPTVSPVVQTPATVNIGDTVTFGENASGPGNLSYQWRLNGTPIAGATNSSYAISNAQPLSSGNYRVAVGNGVAYAKTPAYNFQVNFGTNAPTTGNTSFANAVTINPLVSPAAGLNSNAPATGEILTIAGKPAGKLLWYNWTAGFTGVVSMTTLGSTFDTLLGIYTGTNVSALTSIAEDDDSGGFFTSLVTFNCQQGTTYHVVVAGFKGASGTVILGLPSGTAYRVLAPVAGNTVPVFLQQPASQIVLAGDTVNLSVTASNATSYQWYLGGAPVAGVNTNILSITNIGPGATGNYYVVAANGIGAAQSESAAIEIAATNANGTPTRLSVDKFGDSVDLSTNTTERFRPEDGGGDTGGFTLSQSFSTVGATKEDAEPDHAGQPGGASYWYSYTAPVGTIQFNTAGSSFNTILAIYTGPGDSFSTLTSVGSAFVTNFNAQGQPVVTITNTTAGTKYFIAVDGSQGASGAAHLNIVINSTNTSPATNAAMVTNNNVVVDITSPAKNYTTTNPTVTVRGTVTGLISAQQPFLSFVQLALNNSGFGPITLVATNYSSKLTIQPGGYESVVPLETVTWSSPVNLVPGANVIAVESVSVQDVGDEITSRPATITIFYSTATASAQSKSLLTLLTSPAGRGRISGQRNQANLEINQVYKVSAAPVGNWVFTNWTSGTDTNALTPLLNTPSLTFVMTSNLILQANFVTNPFTAVAGAYSGLFYPTNGVTTDSSGFLTATLPPSSRGAYSGRLLLDGGTYALHGAFDLGGDALQIVPRFGKSSVTVAMHLNLAIPDDQLTGSVMDNTVNSWTSPLLANRAAFNARTNPATNFAGKYTFIIPPAPNATTNSPGGFGAATLAASRAGQAIMSGRLADGVPISQSVAIAKDGSIPFYVSLYSRQGLLMGWLAITNNPQQTLLGPNLTWIKLPGPARTLYAAGFTNANISALGSLYVPPPAGANNFVLTNGTLTISNGGMGSLVYSNLAIAGNKLANQGAAGNPPNLLQGIITPGTGAITLTFRPTGAEANITAHGVVLQNNSATNSAGWFLGSGQSGYFLLQQ